MARHTLTLTVPAAIYRQIEARAKRTGRTLNAEVVALLEKSLAGDGFPTTGAFLAQLALLTDTELWLAAAVRARPEEDLLMQQLLDKRQRTGLTALENDSLQQLATHFERIMLTRARAAALLKQRGHDVTTLSS
ncbi:MAG: hypothetical protein M9928_11510 [Anaerolineae bacterium]|nr:hypothetical protein [Anaerolineae bacterium]MCO5205652.1 hypothetical protein [Anaerolineae bacterium]